MPGSVVTFYSFKGGVGRSLALANVAVLLARWGYKVLCVDWDLEAPGLHHFFRPWLEPGWSVGLLDLFGDVEEGDSLEWLEAITSVNAPGATIPIDLLPAGASGADFQRKLQPINWMELYDKRGLGRQIETMRGEWKTLYDFVLVDSRTGVTDAGGICTIQLPDRLVLVATASRQSVEGIVEVAERATAGRAAMPYDRAGLACVPIISRFDGRVERELSLAWLDDCAERFAPLYRTWAHRSVRARDLLDVLRLPYVPRYSFGEDLPVVLEGSALDPESMSYACATLSALVAHDLDETDLLISRRDTYVATAARGARSKRAFEHDVLLRSGEASSAEFREIAEALERRGLRLALMDEGTRARELAFRQARHFVFLATNDRTDPHLRPDLEVAFRELSVEASEERRIIPVVAGTAKAGQLPPALRTVGILQLGGDVERLVDRMGLLPETSPQDGTSDQVGELRYSPPMSRVLDLARRAAASNINILILGETGVGKEWLARQVHRWSPRADAPFVALNVAALPATLIESELFGHEKGAFTGAAQSKLGLLEAAEGGTILLDEIAEMPLQLQTSLLRVLENREVLPVGGRKPRRINVRFLAATNRDLEAEVANKTFRKDLFFRLNGISLTIPPLRDRPEEVIQFARRFAQQQAHELNRPTPTFSPSARALLNGYAWPGNIRELKNTVERAILLCEDGEIRPQHLPTEKMRALPSPEAFAAVDVRREGAAQPLLAEELERQRIVDALAATAGNQTRAARLLAMPRSTFVQRLALYGIFGPSKTKD